MRTSVGANQLVQLPETMPGVRDQGKTIRGSKVKRIVLGTGPSLLQQMHRIKELHANGEAVLYAINNTPRDFDLTERDAWIACDPAWHEHYGKVTGPFRKFHWDERIAAEHGYQLIPGRWLDGLSTDPRVLSYGHSSGWQALNIAAHECQDGDIILLCGYDMTYRPGEARHYFGDLSDQIGEYPKRLRKFSKFDKGKNDGLLWDYRHIAEQVKRGEVPPIYNCTLDSAMRWFEFYDLEHREFIDQNGKRTDDKKTDA